MSKGTQVLCFRLIIMAGVVLDVILAGALAILVRAVWSVRPVSQASLA